MEESNLFPGEQQSQRNSFPYPQQLDPSILDRGNRVKLEGDVTEAANERNRLQGILELDNELGPAPIIVEPLDILTSSSDTGRQFELFILQQPQTGAVTGLSPGTLGRLPIVPAPVVQLITKRNGVLMDIDLPFLFCSCTLVKEQGNQADEISILSLNPLPTPTARPRKGNKNVPPPPPMQGNMPFVSPILGKTVSTFYKISDLDGSPGMISVFDDISIREAGRYLLKFQVYEARPGSVVLASSISQTFTVVPRVDYPGITADEIVTPLTRQIHASTIPIYLPPLAIPRSYLPSIAPESDLPISLMPFPEREV